MAVHRAVLRELDPATGGLLIRDRRTGDWLIILSSRITAGERCMVFNGLMAQLEAWDRQGYSTAEVRAALSEMAGV